MKIKVSLRDMRFSHSSVSHLKHVALVPEVSKALLSWVKHTVGNKISGVLIGGLAMSFYSKPRSTQDIDMLFLAPSDIPNEVSGFKRSRPGAFFDKDTHVEVEVCSADSINLPPAVAHKVFETAHVFDGLRVASLEAMVVLKLYGSDNSKRRLKDLADVSALLSSVDGRRVDLSDWELSSSHKARLNDVLELLKDE